MIITKQLLQQLINEEFEKAVRRRRLTESSDQMPDPPWAHEEPGQNEPCPRCGSENTSHEEPIPSMLGYGEETALTCNDCGETFAEDPLQGGYHVPRKGSPR